MAYCPPGRVWHLHLWWEGRSHNPGAREEGAETTEDAKIEEEDGEGDGSKQTQGQIPLSLHLPLLKARRDSEPAAEPPKFTEDKENAQVSHGQM